MMNYDELLAIAKDENILMEDRVKYVEEEYKDADLSDFTIHDQLIDLVHRFDDEIAVKAAELLSDCYNFSDIESMDHIDMLQRATVSHKSHEVRQVLLDTLEEIFNCGLDDEACRYMKEDGIMDTTKYLGHPEDYSDCVSFREKQQRVKKFDLFISYASEQRESIVRPLTNHLRDLGVSVWVDIYGGILAGTGLRQELFAALDHARCLCIIISKEYLSKRWTIRELNEIISMRTCKRYPIAPLIHDISKIELANIKEELIKYDKIWLGENNTQSEFPPECLYKLDYSGFEYFKTLSFSEINSLNIKEIARHIASFVNSIPSCDMHTNISEIEQVSSNKKPNDKNDLFLSFVNSQQDIITELVGKLSSKNISVWNADSKARLNDQKRIDIFEMVDHANCFCAFISKEYLKNRLLIYELDEMRRLSQFVDFPVLPILVDIPIEEALVIIDNLDYEDLKSWLNNIMCIDIRVTTLEEVSNEIEIFMKRGLTRYCLKP